MTTVERKEPRTIYPYLIAVFPSLSLYAANTADVRVYELIAPLGLAVFVTALLMFAMRPAIRSVHLRAVLVGLFWGTFFTYSVWSRVLRTGIGFDREFRGAEKLALAVVAFGLAVALLVAIRRVRVELSGFSRFMNVAVLIAVTIPCLNSARWNVQSWMTPSPVLLPLSQPSLPSGVSPNIYFFILDAYTSEGYLQTAFGFDNSAFVSDLRASGFYVADESHSNYSVTRYSIPATLNLDYVHMLVPGTPEWELIPNQLVTKLMHENAAIGFLRQRGYEIVCIDSGLTFSQIRDADRFLSPPWDGAGQTRTSLGARLGLTAFQSVLAGMTPLRSFLLSRHAVVGRNRWDPDFKVRGVPYALTTAATVTADSKPMFVLAHILSPHPPNRFDAQGNVLEVAPAFADGYIQEIQFINARIIEMVAAIRSRDPGAVIVLQGDHGPWADYYGGLSAWPGTREGLVEERTRILNAVYTTSEELKGKLYPEISPINTFRSIFNVYFGANLPLLSERSCVCAWDDCAEYFWVDWSQP